MNKSDRRLNTKTIYRILLILHAFIGIGALFGGLLAIINPSLADFNIPLKKGPFNDFLIPGLILFFVIGLGDLFCAITAYLKSKLQSYFSGIISTGLMIWIVVQCYMLGEINILHVIYFILGLFGLSISIILGFRQVIYPVKLWNKLLKKAS